MIDFSKIHGQKRALEVLSGIFDSKRVPHAMIFTGPEGVGKRLIAERFANALICRGIDTVPCNNCEPCRKIATGSFPDLISVEIPEDKTKILIEQMREIEKILAYRPFYGDRRVIIIDPADKMSDGAFGAILKTLEEPPSGAHFILITSRASSLPATIISRCQKVRFASLTPGEIVEIVKSKGATEKVNEASLLCRGSVSRAESLMEGEFLSLRESTIRKLSKMKLNDPKMVDELSQEVSQPKNKTKTPEILDMLKLWYRDVLIYNLTGNSENIVNRDLIEKWGNGWSKTGQSFLIESVEATEEITQLYLRGINVNMRLAFLKLFIRLTELKYQY